MMNINSVLLVEDDSITNYINTRLIKKVKITNDIHVSLNGAEALSFIKETTSNGNSCPELIFLDINMPVMDGFEFLQKFHALNIPNKDKVVIVMLTTSTHSKDMDKLFNSGNTDFLSKPLTEQKLQDIIAKYFIQNSSIVKTA